MKKVFIIFALIICFDCSVSTFCCAQKLVNATIVTRGRDTIHCFIQKIDKKAKFLDQVVTCDRRGRAITTYTPRNAYCFTVNNNYYMRGARPGSDLQCFINAGPPIQQVITHETKGLEIYILRLDWPSEQDSPGEIEQYEEKKRNGYKTQFFTDYDTARSFVIDDDKKLSNLLKALRALQSTKLYFVVII